MSETHSTPSPSPHGAIDEFKSQAGTVADEIKNLGAAGKHVAEESLDAAKERTRAARDRTTEKASNVEDDLIEYIRDQPLKSVLIAAGIGAFAATWMRRG